MSQHDAVVTAVVGGTTGLGTWLIQGVTLTFSPWITLGVTLMSVLVASAITWGILQAEHKRTKRDVAKLNDLMMETVQRLARIEAKLER